MSAILAVTYFTPSIRVGGSVGPRAACLVGHGNWAHPLVARVVLGSVGLLKICGIPDNNVFKGIVPRPVHTMRRSTRMSNKRGEYSGTEHFLLVYPPPLQKRQTELLRNYRGPHVGVPGPLLLVDSTSPHGCR